MSDAPRDDGYVGALRRCAGRVINAVGRGPRNPERSVERALVELVAVEIRDDVRRPGAYLARPPHLPDLDAELHAVATSNEKKDRELRHDIHEWAAINKDVVASNAQALRVLLQARAKATALLDDPADDSDEEQAQVHAWLVEVSDYALRVFDVDPREAPTSHADLEKWCREQMGKRNPTPIWVYTGSAPDSMRRTTRTAPTRTQAQAAFAAMYKPDLAPPRSMHGDDDD